MVKVKGNGFSRSLLLPSALLVAIEPKLLATLVFVDLRLATFFK
jgi:hypothetical protein